MKDRGDRDREDDRDRRDRDREYENGVDGEDRKGMLREKCQLACEPRLTAHTEERDERPTAHDDLDTAE